MINSEAAPCYRILLLQFWVSNGESKLHNITYLIEICFSVYGGNIHLDVDEKFSADGRSGFNFGSTIMHEIGHSLGLLHSNNYYSIMHPEYAMKAEGDYIPLTVDDIEGIQSIYGK